MSQIIVNSIATNYQIIGNGEVVLLLHGWGDSLNGLKGLANHLSKSYKVVLLDLPGFGSSGLPTNQPWNLKDYAIFTESFLNKINIPEVYAISGHSNGGAISIVAVASGIIKPKKIILLSSSGVRAVKAGHSKSALAVGKKITSLLPARYQKGIRRKIYEISGSDILVVPELEPTFKKIVAQDIQKDAENINVPTLLIYGNNDKATPPEYGKILSDKIRNSRMVYLNDAGHFVHLDQPERVQKEIDNFLGNINV